jgi:hypothetical protein
LGAAPAVDDGADPGRLKELVGVATTGAVAPALGATALDGSPLGWAVGASLEALDALGAPDALGAMVPALGACVGVGVAVFKAAPCVSA